MYADHTMISKITPVKAIRFIRISVALVCAWPPSPKLTKSFTFFKASWCMCYFSSILLLLPLLRSIYEYRDDPVILAKSVCLSCAVLQVTIKMMVCLVQYTSFQVLYHDMEMFCKQADDKTSITLQRYVDDYKYTYGTYTLWCYLAAIGVICGPLILPQQFPTDAKYPFSVEQQPVKSIIYLHQSLVGLQVSAGMCIECSIAMLLFYSAARLELLIQKMRNVETECELDACIKLHNEILRYIDKIIHAVWPLVLTTITTTTMGVVFGSLNMVTDQPIIVKIQYAIVVFSASVELFMCAFPADNLMHMSNKICFGAYESKWFQGSVSMQKKVLQIIFRSQKPEVIRINGILPALSLRYYAGVNITHYMFLYIL
ncbi:Odorant receptor 326 [Nylanderia fulva]|uniref:Odorant receptor n=1 Tax=Nylanderia fulva TaxID=613905 RepID=A0A6G1LRI2_9HYME|nr:Odorant receptor 326 [Nylanderia fulva]